MASTGFRSYGSIQTWSIIPVLPLEVGWSKPVTTATTSPSQSGLGQRPRTRPFEVGVADTTLVVGADNRGNESEAFIESSVGWWGGKMKDMPHFPAPLMSVIVSLLAE